MSLLSLFHGENTGSSPVGRANGINELRIGCDWALSVLLGVLLISVCNLAYHRTTRRPSAAPMSVIARMATPYQTKMKGMVLSSHDTE